jgi:hypothetical protein
MLLAKDWASEESNGDGEDSGQHFLQDEVGEGGEQ